MKAQKNNWKKKNLLQKSAALLMTAMMCISLLSVSSLAQTAAVEPTDESASGMTEAEGIFVTEKEQAAAKSEAAPAAEAAVSAEEAEAGEANDAAPETAAEETVKANDTAPEAAADETVEAYEKEDAEPNLSDGTPEEVEVFGLDFFSIYVAGEDDKGDPTLTDEEGEAHYVYHVIFYADLKGSGEFEALSVQTLSPGEQVEVPGVPEKDHAIFKGWFTEKEGGTQYDFSQMGNKLPEITGEADVELPLYAQYEEIYYVHYMIHPHAEGDEETNAVFHTEAYTQGDPLDTTMAEKLYLAEGYLSQTDPVTGVTVTTQAVTGWTDAGGKEWQTGAEADWAAMDGALELYPVIKSAYWIYFDMNEVHVTEEPAPVYVLADAVTIGDLPAPETSGYAFEDWYTKAEGGTPVTSSAELASLPKNDDGSITLYAHWTKDYVAYTINIWRQKPTDGQAGLDQKESKDGETYEEYIGCYDYAESHYVPASQSRLKTGDTPAASTVNNWSAYTGYGTTSNTNSAYYGFEYKYSTSQYGTTTTSAVRTLNELAGKKMAADGSTVINIYYNRVTVSWTFKTSSYGSTAGTLIGLYDTNITPTNGSDAAGTLSAWPDPYNGKLWNAYGTSYTFEAKYILIDNSVAATFTPGNSAGSKLLHYYLEVTNEAAQVDVNSDAHDEAVNTYHIDYTRTVDGTRYVYYRTIHINANFTIENKFIGYHYIGYTLGNDETTIPKNQTGTYIGSKSEYFLFSDANRFTITLFSNSKVVGVNDSGEAWETTASKTYDAKYGEDLSSYDFPDTLDGAVWGPAYYYHFTGIWYEDPYLTSSFTAVTMPNSNLAAYADWELNDITVKFVANTTDVLAPETQTIKAAGTAADPGILEREGYSHVGWVDQNGKVFNFETVLYEDTTLTAIWKADDETGYQLHYHLNPANSHGLLNPADYPDGADVSTNKEHFEAGDYEELWTIEQAFPELNGADEIYSKFICWNTQADGLGTSYYPDDVIYIDGDTTLYAIWAHENQSTLVLVHNYPAGYTPPEGTDNVDVITQSNLTEIDVETESGLHYHDEITVIDAGGVMHTYRFEGWSTTQVGSEPTEADVNIQADAAVKVDTLLTGETGVNYLYAVWMEAGRSIDWSELTPAVKIPETNPDDSSAGGTEKNGGTTVKTRTDGKSKMNTKIGTDDSSRAEAKKAADAKSGTDVPKTADTQRMSLLLMLLILCVMAVAVALHRKRSS